MKSVKWMNGVTQLHQPIRNRTASITYEPADKPFGLTTLEIECARRANKTQAETIFKPLNQNMKQFIFQDYRNQVTVTISASSLVEAQNMVGIRFRLLMINK